MHSIQKDAIRCIYLMLHKTLKKTKKESIKEMFNNSDKVEWKYINEAWHEEDLFEI